MEPERGENKGRTTVLYSWTESGVPERCQVKGALFDGEECYHCLQPINGAGMRLLAPDGDVYALHRGCARDGCATADRTTIDAVCDSQGD